MTRKLVLLVAALALAGCAPNPQAADSTVAPSNPTTTSPATALAEPTTTTSTSTTVATPATTTSSSSTTVTTSTMAATTTRPPATTSSSTSSTTAATTTTVPATTTTAAPKIYVVKMDDNFFDPMNHTVNIGDTVRWDNVGLVPHTSTAPGAWDSGIVNPSSSYQVTVDQPGTYNYLCTIHPGQTGTIVVQGG